MKTIGFSEDWNSKLQGGHFTTIRPHAYEYPEKGKVEIQLPDGETRPAKIVDNRTKKIRNLTGWITRLDADMGLTDFYDLMKNFYSDKDFWNGTDTEVDILLIRWLEE